MALTAGSIAFVGYDADGMLRLAILAVDPLPAGTVIYLTDRRWLGSAFEANGAGSSAPQEGTLTWTVPTGGIASGTLVSFDDVNNIPTGSASTSSSYIAAERNGASVPAGSIQRTGSFDSEQANEVLYAYTGAINAPSTFLAAIANDGFTTANGVLTGTGLTAGSTAVDIGAAHADADFGVYRPTVGGTTFNSRAAMLAAVNNPSNWLVLDTGSDDSSAYVPLLTNSASPIQNVIFAINIPPPVFTPGDQHADLVINAAEAAGGETFRFTGQAGNRVTLTFTGTSGSVSGVVATESSPGVYTALLTQAQLAGLGQGNFTVSATAADGFGNRSLPGTGTVTLDTVPPPVPVFVPGDQHGAPDFSLTPVETGKGETFTFTTEPGASVSVTFTVGRNTITRPATEDPLNPGTYTVYLDNADLNELGTGTITIQANATDAAGNTSGNSNDTINMVVCFCTGTRIATPGGEVPVESLSAGDLVLLADGSARPVRWVGHQKIIAALASPTQDLPVRITAGALGENLPRRDLLVSPAHALAFGDVLVQAGALVNGTTIRRETPVPRVFTYWHVELDAHALLLAEGVPAESFLDSVELTAFDNAADRPDTRAVAELDMPRARSHRQVPGHIRALIAERAAALAPTEAAA